MEVVFKKDKKYESFYNKFILINNVSWAYLPKFIDFQKIQTGNNLKHDLSFLIINNNEPICICPLFIEEIHGKITITSVGSYLRGPIVDTKLDEKYKKKVERRCFIEIDKTAEKFGISKIMILLDPLCNEYKYNILTEYGYFNTTIATTIVDLTKDEKVLWANLRKSFQSLINNGFRKYNVEIIDYKNSNYEIHEKYRELHHKAAGRITRDKETFEIQYNMLKDDNALLIGLKDNGKFIAFSYFFHFNESVYYGSSSDDPEYETDIPLEHTIIWAAIEYYKQRKFKKFEIGWQYFGRQFFENPSDKDISISFFKRGFGGDIVNLYRGVKFLNKDCLKELIQN